jgi:ribonuclease P protein component
MALRSLKNDKEFDAVFKNGKRYRTEFGSIIIRNSDDLGIGLIAGKKLGGAVVRNRIKRIAKESFRRMVPEINRPVEVVYLPNEKAAKVSQGQLQTDIASVFIKAGILNRTH